MINPMLRLPLNTKRVYTMEKTHDGCEIYIPIDSFDDVVIHAEKKKLRDYLYSVAPIDNAPLLA